MYYHSYDDSRNVEKKQYYCKIINNEWTATTDRYTYGRGIGITYYFEYIYIILRTQVL